jgi:hypothetical protein
MKPAVLGVDEDSFACIEGTLNPIKHRDEVAKLFWALIDRLR